MALPLRKHCLCGALVWDAPAPRYLPKVQELIICPKCGRDNSRRIPIWYALRFYWRRFWKRRRAYGIIGMWRAQYPVPFWEVRRKALPVSHAAERIIVWGSVSDDAAVGASTVE